MDILGCSHNASVDGVLLPVEQFPFTRLRKVRCRTSKELWDSGSQTLRRSEEVMTRAGGGSEHWKQASSIMYNQQREQTHYLQVFSQKDLKV